MILSVSDLLSSMWSMESFALSLMTFIITESIDVHELYEDALYKVREGWACIPPSGTVHISSCCTFVFIFLG